MTFENKFENNNIYPKMEDKNLEDKVCETINKTRISEFTSDKKRLEDLLVHYKKVRKRWTAADSGIKLTGLVIAGTLGVASAVTGGCIIIIPGIVMAIVSAVCGGIGAVNLFLIEGVSIGVTSKRKKFYREICECIEHGIDKLYLFHQRALKDGVLSDGELTESKKIIKDVQNQISTIKKSMPPDYEVDNRKELLKNLKQEFKNKMKDLKKT